GDYNQAAAGALNVEIAGTNAATPDFDQLVVSGAVTLGGALNLSLLNGFDPLAGNTFRILDKTSAGPISGTFAGLPEGAMFSVGLTTFRITYVGGEGNNDVVLTIPPAVYVDPVILPE